MKTQPERSVCKDESRQNHKGVYRSLTHDHHEMDKRKKNTIHKTELQNKPAPRFPLVQALTLTKHGGRAGAVESVEQAAGVEFSRPLGNQGSDGFTIHSISCSLTWQLILRLCPGRRDLSSDHSQCKDSRHQSAFKSKVIGNNP